MERFAVDEEPVRFASAGQQVIGVVHRPLPFPAPQPEGGTPAGRALCLPPVVVFCHGFTGHKVESHRLFVKAARALGREGCAALRFDFRGSGDSAGEFEEMTVSGEVQDAVAAVQFAREHVGRPVALLGLSLGGAVAALATERLGDVAALVLWSAVARPARIARAMGERSSGAPSVVTWQGHYDLGGNLVGQAFVADILRIDPLQAARSCQVPVLVIHGTRDQSVPPEDASAYMEAFPGPDKTLHLVEGADHTFSRGAWEDEVIRLTVGWLAARLRRQ